jgi:hypothetical protein
MRHLRLLPLDGSISPVAIVDIRHETIDVYKSETVVARWRRHSVIVQISSSAPLFDFLWAKGMEPKNINKEMLPIYGEKCVSRQADYNWVQKFSEGRTRIEDEHRVSAMETSCVACQKKV